MSQFWAIRSKANSRRAASSATISARWSCKAISRPTYTRKIMAGAIFAGGRVSSFHLTSLARHSVHRLLLRRWLEGLDSLRWLQVGLSRPVNPALSEGAAALPGSVALLLFHLLPAPGPIETSRQFSREQHIGQLGFAVAAKAPIGAFGIEIVERDVCSLMRLGCRGDDAGRGALLQPVEEELAK